LVRKSVELAREARDECIVGLLSERDGEGGEKVVKLKGKNLLVAGSVGPYGAYLADGSEYTGSYNLTDTAMKDFHRGRIAALISAGSDILALETIPSFAETRALLTLLATEFPSTEAWISFSLRSSFQISDGTPLQEVVRFVEQFPNIVVAVGANCVAVDVAVEAVKVLKGYTRLPVVVYPNSGEVWNAEARGWKGERSDGEKLVERTREFWEAGARIIGGCCRTTPGDVEVIAETLRGVE
jgi:homocysteine S-methyltransferase